MPRSCSQPILPDPVRPGVAPDADPLATRHPRFPGRYGQSNGTVGPDPALIPLCRNRPRPASGLTRNPDSTATSRLDTPPMPTRASPHAPVRPGFQQVNYVPVTEPPQGTCHGYRTWRSRRCREVPHGPPDEMPGDHPSRETAFPHPGEFSSQMTQICVISAFPA